MSEREFVTIKFDGPSHQVGLEVFTTALLDYSVVLSSVSEEIGVGRGINIEITAIKSGSLDVILSVGGSVLGGLLALAPTAKDLADVVSAAADLYGLKQKLAGKGRIESIEASETGVSTITTESGDIINAESVTVNIFQSRPDATEAISHSFGVLAENEDIEALQFSSRGERIFRASSDEFSEIARSCDFEGEDVRFIIRSNVYLSVVKPYMGDSTTRVWEFRRAEGKLSAPVGDKEFLADFVKGRHVLTPGVVLVADIEVKQEFSKRDGLFIDKSSVVKHVRDVIPPDTTERLPLECE